MDPRQLFTDERLIGMCTYCGGAPESRDHVPSKVLIDKPYPSQLPVVGACEKCNHSFSKDEQYVACFIECVICGTVNPDELQRAAVSSILNENPSLRDRISASRMIGGSGELIWTPEAHRFQNVALKLALGHLAYELHPYPKDMFQVGILPLANLDAGVRSEFEVLTRGNPHGWSEVGTRAFHRELGKTPDRFDISGDWIVVQPGRYRYAVSEAQGPLVRMVLSEYLACAVFQSQ